MSTKIPPDPTTRIHRKIIKAERRAAVCERINSTLIPPALESIDVETLRRVALVYTTILIKLLGRPGTLSRLADIGVNGHAAQDLVGAAEKVVRLQQRRATP